MGYAQVPGKQEKTQSITFRLPKRILEQIELEAKQNNVSENVLVRQILTNYIDWFRLSKGIGMMPITKELLGQMNRHIDIASINSIVENLALMLRTFSIIRYGKYDLDTIFDALSMYIQMSNLHIVHLKEKNIHRFLISHNLGMTWSLILEELFRFTLKEFVPVENIKFKTTDDSLIASLALSNDV